MGQPSNEVKHYVVICQHVSGEVEVVANIEYTEAYPPEPKYLHSAMYICRKEYYEKYSSRYSSEEEFKRITMWYTQKLERTFIFGRGGFEG